MTKSVAFYRRKFQEEAGPLAAVRVWRKSNGMIGYAIDCRECVRVWPKDDGVASMRVAWGARLHDSHWQRDPALNIWAWHLANEHPHQPHGELVADYLKTVHKIDRNYHETVREREVTEGILRDMRTQRTLDP